MEEETLRPGTVSEVVRGSRGRDDDVRGDELRFVICIMLVLYDV